MWEFVKNQTGRGRCLFICFWLILPQAARAGNNPDPATFQADVQAAVNLMLRGEQLQIRREMRGLTPAETQELAATDGNIAKIRAKYVDPFSLLTKFNDHTVQLFKEQELPARRQWLDEAYPDPRQLLAAYPNEPERAAALFVIRSKLLNANGNWTQGKAAAYAQTLQQVQAEETKQGVKLDDGGLTPEQRVLIYRAGGGIARARDFQEQLFEKFLPAAIAPMKQEDAAARKDDLNALKGSVSLVLAALIILVLPWLLLPRGRRRAETIARADGGNDPLMLPEELRVVQLPRLRYAVRLESGQVIDEKTWSETHVNVSTTGGHVNVSSGPALGAPGYAATNVQVTPVQVHTRSTVIQKDRIWIRTPQNQQSAWTFSGGDFLTRQQQVISILALPRRSDSTALLAYNHTTGNLCDFGFSPLDAAHTLSVFWIWLLTTVLAGIGVGYAARLDPAAKAGFNSILMPAFFIFLVAALAGIYLFLIKVIFQIRRARAFRRKYFPAYRQFFEQITPELLKCFNATH